MRILDLLYH